MNECKGEAAAAAENRLKVIDAAKGLAIVLVVLGHIVARQLPVGNDWYGVLKSTAYQFHMPFFMALSGFVLELSFRQIDTVRAYFSYVTKKFTRIFPAYLVVGLFIVFGKMVASLFFHVDNVPDSGFIAVFNLLVFPMKSGAGFLWYVYVLFLFCVIFPFIHLLLRHAALVLLLGVGLNLAGGYAPDVFMLNSVFEYFLFVCVGGLLAVRYKSTGKINIPGGAIWFLLLSVGIVACNFVDWSVEKLMLGFVAVPGLLWLVSKRQFLHSPVLAIFGRYVFVIYLLNTLVIGVVKAVGLKVLPWDGFNFLLYFPVLWASGLFVPILIKKYVFSRIPAVDKCTD